MNHHLNDDCWRMIFQLLQNDHHTLFQLLLTSKYFFLITVPILYRQPLIDYSHLSVERKSALQDTLRPHAIYTHNWRLRPDAFIYETVICRFNYFARIQEMSDDFVDETGYNWSASDFAESDNWEYRQIFGSKIQSLALWMPECELLLEKDGDCALSIFKTLREIYIWEYIEVCTEEVPRSSYETISELIQRFRQENDGRDLDCLSYMRTDNAGNEDYETPMMVFIRNEMGGSWGKKSQDFEFVVPPCIPSNEFSLRTILNDEELPKQLLTVGVRKLIEDVDAENEAGEEEDSDGWSESVATFLSRCRSLKSVFFKNYLPPRILAWAVDEQQQRNHLYSQPKTFGSRSPLPRISLLSGSQDLLGSHTICPVEWKSIIFEMEIDPHGSPTLSSSLQMKKVAEAWTNILVGFGHCVETLELSLFEAQAQGAEGDDNDDDDNDDDEHFYTTNTSVSAESAIQSHQSANGDIELAPLSILSFPTNSTLSNLRELTLSCPKFDLSTIPDLLQLQKLSIKISEWIEDRDDNGVGDWSFDWIRFSKLRELLLQHIEEVPVCTVVESSESWPTTIELQQQQCDADDSETQGLVDELERCSLNGGDHGPARDDPQPTTVITTRLQFLTKVYFSGHFAYDFCMNLGLDVLLIAPNLDTLEVDCSTTLQPMDTTNIFKQIHGQSLTFPKFKNLMVYKTGLRLSQSHLSCLLGLDDENSDIFPALSWISIGSVVLYSNEKQSPSGEGRRDDNMQMKAEKDDSDLAKLFTVIEKGLGVDQKNQKEGLNRERTLVLNGLESADKNKWREYVDRLMVNKSEDGNDDNCKEKGESQFFVGLGESDKLFCLGRQS